MVTVVPSHAQQQLGLYVYVGVLCLFGAAATGIKLQMLKEIRRKAPERSPSFAMWRIPGKDLQLLSVHHDLFPHSKLRATYVVLLVAATAWLIFSFNFLMRYFG